MPHQLSCPDCGAPVPAGNVNLELLVASCPTCDAVFGFSDHVGRRADEGEAAAVGASAPGAVEPTAPASVPDVAVLPPPSGVSEQEGPDGLVLSVSWWSIQAVVIGVFALIWNGMLVFMASALLSGGQVESLAFMGLHAAAGIGMLYYAVASFLNTTEITVNRVGIDVAHGPLPWPGARTLPVAQIDQLFVEKRIIRGKNSTRTVYDLKAAARAGRRLKVATGLADYDDARYLEHRIEGYLGIVDRPVAGEHAG